MTPENRPIFRHAWVQLPYYAWLVFLWMLLWGQFTWLSLVTGILVTIFVNTVFRLPNIELSGRVSLVWSVVFAAQFLWAVMRGSLHIAAQVLDFRKQPSAGIVGVKLPQADDLLMTHVSVVCSLIPGSLVLEADRATHTLYFHVLGIKNEAEAEAFRQQVLQWERRVVRAVGSRAQNEWMKQHQEELTVPIGPSSRRERRDEPPADVGPPDAGKAV